MIKKIFYILFVTLCLQSCFNKKNDTIIKNEMPDIVVSEKKDNTEIEVVKKFMKWYLQNMDSIYKFNTIGGGLSSENKVESDKNYYVNFDEVEKYLSELKKSGFLSANFLQKEKQTFIDGEKYFKENPINDGPPYGFDYDHFFLTQDAFEEDLPNIDKAKCVFKKNDDSNCEVEISLPICMMNYKYSLKKINSKWLIEKIESIEK